MMDRDWTSGVSSSRRIAPERLERLLKHSAEGKPKTMNKARWILLGMVLLALAAGEVPLLSWPFRLLETFFHELSHGLTAIATGGEIVSIKLMWSEGGLCVHRGGVRLFTAFSGYFGSVLWGAAIFLAATAVKRRNAVLLSGLLAVTVGLSTLLWMRDPISILI
ncbi:MAG: M50 family metallopeptidase, partial [Magnetococcales bacterium]|nr:M50 family metallopeptidase [Magnetococcales bacterium]